MSKKESDYVFHEPGGSSLPGSPDANPYVFYPPDDIRKLIETEKDPDELAKLKSALRQWERIYIYPGYPYKIAAALRIMASKLLRLSERTPVPQNMPYYNDSQVPVGLGDVMYRNRNVRDDQHNIFDDYHRQGERPTVDTEQSKGNYLSPSEPPIGDTVKERGSGPDPEGMQIPEPGTGGDIDSWFQGI